jgi:hypothetical protein
MGLWVYDLLHLHNLWRLTDTCIILLNVTQTMTSSELYRPMSKPQTFSNSEQEDCVGGTHFVQNVKFNNQSRYKFLKS